MEFTAQNIQSMEETLDEISIDPKEFESKYNSAREQLTQLMQDNKSFDELIMNNVNGKVALNVIPESMYPFARALWWTAQYDSLRKQANQLVVNYKPIITRDLASVSIRKKKIRWAFSSRKKRDEALNAFNELQKLLDEDYGPKVREILRKLREEKNNINTEKICAEIRANRYYYQLTAHREIEEDRLETPITNVFHDVISKIQALQSDLLEEEKHIYSLRENVYKQACDAQQILLSSGLADELIEQLKKIGLRHENKISETLNLSISANNKIPIITRLLKAIFQYKDGIDQKRSLDQLHQKDEVITKDLNILHSPESGLRWFFYSQEEKEDIIEAYRNLCSLVTGAYGEAVKNALAESEPPKDNTVWEDFSSVPFSYFNILEETNPGLLGNKYGFDFIDLEIKKCRSIMMQVERRLSLLKKNVFNKACLARQHQAYEELAKIPIEQIKREISGARLKPLKDWGYNSMADVYSADVYELGSIEGISYNRAFAIKQAASDYEKTIEETLKFKISADKKTPEVTDLLKAIFQYKKELSKSKVANQLHQYDEPIQNKLSLLQSAQKGLEWFCYTQKEKGIIISAYTYLLALLSGPYHDDIEKLQVQVNSIRSSQVWDDFCNDPVSYFNILEETNPGLLGNGDSKYGLPEKIAREIQDETFSTDGLKCKLRRYQEWGVKYILHQKRVLLGDEMGLGKTIQAIAAMVALKNCGATHFMIICPASVMTNWSREIALKSKFRPLFIHGPNKKKAFSNWQKYGGVAITTYETTKSFVDQNMHLDFLTVDEAHYIKNPNSQRSINVRRIASQSSRLLFMSGTPLENNVNEMISLIDILRPDIAQKLNEIAFMSTAPQFRESVASVYYRRKREDVLTELPDLELKEEWCDLKPSEKEIYEKTVFEKNFMAMRRISWNVSNLKDSSKAEHLKKIVDQVTKDGRKIIVFSFFRDTIKKIEDAFQKKCYGPITGGVSVGKRQEIIDRFEKASSGSILLAQIQAGGTGLNIQSASVVVLCEPQIKPSIENQAISRAYRMGQTRSVLVYRLLCSNSIDERMLEILFDKQLQFDTFADKSVAAENSETLDNISQDKIIQLEIERIKKEREAG